MHTLLFALSQMPESIRKREVPEPLKQCLSPQNPNPFNPLSSPRHQTTEFLDSEVAVGSCNSKEDLSRSARSSKSGGSSITQWLPLGVHLIFLHESLKAPLRGGGSSPAQLEGLLLRCASLGARGSGIWDQLLAEVPGRFAYSFQKRHRTKHHRSLRFADSFLASLW